MADINANIGVHIDTSAALAELKALQRQISAFHSQIAASANAANMATAANMQRNLMQSINATGKFAASMTSVKSTSEAFTTALEKNKLSMREYFRYAGGATKTFGRLFRSEFDVIEKTARERVKTLQTQYIKMGRDANGAVRAIKVRPLALDMQNLATQTAMAAQKQQLFNQLLKQGTTNLLNWGKNTQWAGRQLMVGFTVPLTILGTVAIKTFKEIETQAIRFRRVYGELFTTQAETDRMLNSLRDLGSEFTRYGVSLEKTLSLAADAAAMGKTGADLLAQVNEANRLAVLGGVEQEQALETTISLTNAFGIAADELSGKIDFLNAVENQTVTSIEDLTIAIPKAGPVIQQLGGDVEDLAFFLTAMKEGGINASEGANALKSGLASLINPTDKASEFLAGFGINLKGIVEANKGDVKSTVIAFAQALDTLDPLNRARAIEQLFGKFQFARLSTLFQNVIAEGTQAERVLELSRATSEQLAILSQRELSKIEESPLFKFQKAIEDLQIQLAPLGEEFIKLITPIIEFGTGILEEFNKLDSGAKQFITGLVAVLGLVAPAALMTIGLVGNGIANLLKGFNAVRLFYGKLTGSTQQLGVTTQYMTQEQLEAAAASASLGQSHSQLTQIFSAETTAVQALTTAYNNAVIAQNKLMGGGKMPRGAAAAPKVKAAKGLVMVPGPKGAGDIVPAMLSPGEAIIPADKAERYRNLIKAMIAGKIPGYAEGTAGKGKNKAPAASYRDYKTNAGVLTTHTLNTSRQQGLFNFGNYNFENAITGRQSTMQFYMKDIIDKLAAKQGISSLAFADDITSKTQEFRRNNKELINQIEERTKRYEAKIDSTKGKGNIVRTLARLRAQKEFGSMDKIPTDPAAARERKELNRLFKKLEANFQKELGPTLKQLSKQFDINEKKYRTDLNAAQKFVRDNKINLRTAQGVAKLEAWANKNNNLAGRLMTQRDNTYQKYNPARGLTVFGGSNIGASLARFGLPGFLFGQRASEVKLSSSIEHFADTKETAGKTAPAKPKPKAKPKTPSAKAAAKLNNDAKEKSLQQARAKLAPGYSVNREGKRLVYRNAAGQRVTATEAKTGKPYVSQPRAGAVQPDTDGTQQKVKQPMTVQRFMGKAATVSAVAGMGAMGASFMGGEIGALANQIMMPLLLLAGVLPMLANKFGLILIAIGAVIAGIVAWNVSLQEATKRGLALGESLGITNDNLKAMSEITGTVSASEEEAARRENQLNPMGPEGRKFGQNYVESEPGQALLADINKQLQSGRGIAQTGQNIGRQLAYAIAQGVITAEEGKSIAAALGQELGDYSIAAKIAGTITSIVGPNGEDLATEPLQVALRISKQSMQESTQLFEASMNKINPFIGLQGLGTAYMSTGQKAMFDPLSYIGPLGTVVNSIGTFITTLNQQGQAVNETVAATLSYNAQLLQQQQGNIDWLTQNFANQRGMLEEEIALAESAAAATTSEEEKASINARILLLKQQIADLTKEEELSLKTIRAENARNYEILLNQTKEIQKTGALPGTLDEFLNQNYEQGTAEYILAKQATDQIKGLQDLNLQAALTINFMSGQMSGPAITSLINAFANNQEAGAMFSDLVSKRGVADANQILTLLSMANLDPTSPAFGPLFSSFTNLSDSEFNDRINAISQIVGVEQRLGFEVNLETVGEEQIQQVIKDMNALEQIEDPMTKEAFADFKKTNPLLYDAIMADWDRLSNADGTLNREIAISVSASGNLDVLSQYLIATGQMGAKVKGVGLVLSADRADQATRNATPEQIAAASVWAQPNTPKTLQDSASGLGDIEKAAEGAGGAANDVFSNILNQLKRVRDASINAAGGVKELMRILGGGKNISIFGGIEQQLISQGMNEQFVDFIASLDPKEAKQFYDINKQGEIILTKVGLAMKKAFDEKILGDFQLKQLSIIAGFKNQTIAISKLVKSGVSLAAAYDLASDAALAAAIANGKISSAEWKDLVATIKAAEVAAKRYAAAQAVADANQAVKDQQKILNWISQNAGMLNSDLIQGIMADTDLQQLILLGGSLTGQEANAIRERLQQILNNAELELKIKKLTIEGMEDIFSDGFNKAQEAFAAQEKKLELDFELTTKADQDIVEAAERQISAINFTIDDLEAQLKGIADQEEKVNEKYDARIEALDKIDGLNETIANRQKAQLTIADALTRGDISAAAKAIQDLREQEASAQSAQQRELINKQRQIELDALVSASGKTRKQLEQEIKTLKDQIFQIEEQSLEPAQRRIELAQDALNDAKEQLTVLGMTRDEWERIQNNIDLAKTSSDSYIEAIEEAKNIVEDIINYWEELDGKEVNINQIINTIQNAPGTAPAAPATPGGSGGGGGGGSNNNGPTQPIAPTPEYYTTTSSHDAIMNRVNAWRSNPYAMAIAPTVGTKSTAFKNLWIRYKNAPTPQEALALKPQLKNAYDSLNSALRAAGYASGGLVNYKRMGGMIPYKRMGGLLPYKAMGGLFKEINTDTVPAMLTPGEFIVRRHAVQNFGVDKLKAINNGTYDSGSVYNYSVNVSVQTDANPDQIARAVMSQIKQIDSMRIRGNRF